MEVTPELADPMQNFLMTILLAPGKLCQQFVDIAEGRMYPVELGEPLTASPLAMANVICAGQAPRHHNML
jgi:hypothetical protein